MGGHSEASAPSRLRAAVNARLEEISFRAGVTAAMIALIALAGIATAGVFAATLSLGGTAVAAQGAPTATSTPATAPTTAAAQPTATPRATHPVTAATTVPQPVTAPAANPQPTAGSQAWTQEDGSQARPRYYGRADFGGHGSRYGDGSWPWPGGAGYPGHGFGFPRQGGWGRP
jgi:hypothetical protein